MIRSVIRPTGQQFDVELCRFGSGVFSYRLISNGEVNHKGKLLAF